MNFFTRFLCLGALACIPFLGHSDDLKLNFKFELIEKKSYATLDDLSGSLLNDPYVLTKIGVRPSQMFLVPWRDKTNQIFSTLAAAQSASVDTSDEDRSVYAAEVMRLYQKTSGIVLADLDAAQRKKLQSIAMKDYALSALLTKEVNFALGLTPDQLKRLQTIRSEFWARCGKIEEKTGNSAKFIQIVKSMGESNGEELSATDRLAKLNLVYGKLEKVMVNSIAQIEKPVMQAGKEANARALGVLTKSQASAYKRLQG